MGGGEHSQDMFYSFIDSASHGGDTASFGENLSQPQHPHVRNVASESDLEKNNKSGKAMLIKDVESENNQLRVGAAKSNLI